MRTVPFFKSLSWDVIANVALGEITLALVLMIAAGSFTTLSIVERRANTMREVGDVIAAALTPTQAELASDELEERLRQIVTATTPENVSCIRVVDTAGATIAAHGVGDACELGDLVGSASPVALLTKPLVVRRPILSDGRTLAYVYITYDPLDIAEILWPPVAAAAIALLSVVLISVPWTTMRFVRFVIWPLRDLERYAARIAAGEEQPVLRGRAIGELRELQETLRDMAERLRARDEALRGSYDSLSSAFESLREAKDEIERLSALKTDFVAVAAHELRSPLATITLFTEMLESGDVTPDSVAGVEAVGAIRSAALRLSSIASDLMDSALLERGTLLVHFDVVDLADVVRGAVDDSLAGAHSAGVRLRLVASPETTHVEGDALRLRQVLDNLLSNAVKYSPEGGDVVVSTFRDQDTMVIEVADCGPTIPEQDRERVFGLFVRLDVADSRSTGGLGLGLAITRRIVEAHGGTIDVRPNEDDTGNVFRVVLPVKGTGSIRSGQASIAVVRQREAT